LGVNQQFLNHIRRHRLCKTTDKILLAVSGGMDSMVMVHLFTSAGFSIGIAHGNFGLRSHESDGDEQFVHEHCQRLGVPFFSTRFNTEDVATKHGVSLQMAARQLRYDWFETLAQEQGFHRIATAHHLNDQLETVLLNLVRGTGFDGLSGIPVENGRVIRPMLFASRDMIRRYALSNQLSWREDSSNATDHYKRNFVRHHVIPLLREVNPNLENTFRETGEKLSAAHAWFNEYLEDVRAEVISSSPDHFRITRLPLLDKPEPAVLLWELIKEKGFNLEQCREMIEVHQPGKTFYAGVYRLTVDREHFLIDQPSEHDSLSRRITEGEKVVPSEEGTLTFTFQVAPFTLQKREDLAQLDLGKLRFPLTWRRWHPGDAIMPLGMKGMKKLSDLFIDLKIPLPEKEKITVIESDGVIVWVVGYRIHDLYKVTSETRKVLTIGFLPKGSEKKFS
jgi:tRNA(Ile)-lysidine synthase